MANVPNPHVVLSAHERAVVEDYDRFITNPFNNSITNLDISALRSAITKYNHYLELAVTGQQFGSGFTPGFAPAGLVSALALIPNLIGGNFSLSAEQQTTIIDGLTKYYAEEFRKAQMLTYMQSFENTIGRIGELEVLLPQTLAKLKSADPSRFPEIGDEYKTVFNEDLKNVIDNLLNHIDHHTATGNSALESRLIWLGGNRW